MSNDNTWRINKEIDKDMIQSDAYSKEYLDARELYIRVNTTNYIQYEDGQIAHIGEPSHPNELVWDGEY